jgi:uncharacterized membrane protein
VAEFVVLGFSNTHAADEVAPQLTALQREGLLDLADWARVIRQEDGRVDVRQGNGTGAVGGALWGLLFGLMFLMPLTGMLIGGATGALMRKLGDFGIDDRFIEHMSHQLAPGTSALFLYVNTAITDRVIDRLRQYQPNLLRTSLSKEAEDKLQAEMQSSALA